MLAAIADGKVYVFTSEHSPNVPPYKGSRVRCIDAYTGEELWTVLGWGSVGTGNSASFAVADGYMVYLNTYDMQVYCFGKGPSATTIEAPLASIAKGQSLIIQGTVNDISSGAKTKIASGQFTSVPAVSDASIGQWMEYIYMQKPCPTTTTGVQVKLTATDQNGQTTDIATVTSDPSGLYYYKWAPSAEGTYKITATFAGSNSYWGSSATTAIGVDSAAAVPTQTVAPTPTLAPTQTPIATPTASPTPAPEPATGIPTETLLIAGAAVIIIIAVISSLSARKKTQINKNSNLSFFFFLLNDRADRIDYVVSQEFIDIFCFLKIFFYILFTYYQLRFNKGEQGAATNPLEAFS